MLRARNDAKLQRRSGQNCSAGLSPDSVRHYFVRSHRCQRQSGECGLPKSKTSDLFVMVSCHFTSHVLIVPVNENGRCITTQVATLLALSTLGDILHGLAKWLGVFVVVNPAIRYVVPRDVGIEMMSFGLLFEQSFQFSQFLRVLFG